jgi:hypothetical protein
MGTIKQKSLYDFSFAGAFAYKNPRRMLFMDRGTC